MRSSIREQLTNVEERLRSLREERTRATKVTEAAKAAAAESDNDAAFDAAKAAADAMRSVEAKIEEVQAEQVGLLRRIGDSEAGRAGFAYSGVDGWALAANKLDLARGNLRVDVGASALLAARSRATLPPTPRDGSFSLSSPTETNRYLYPVFDQVPFGSDSDDLAATDFVITFDMAALTGVEREPDATTEKAVLSPAVALATVEAKQHAVVLDSIPSKLFGKDALRSLLGVEMARQVDQSVDAHVVNAIEAAAPPNGSTGADLVARIRNAIAAMLELGGQPRYLALTPADAASLDLTVQPGTGDYVFRVDVQNSGSPVWSLLVREVPTISAPTLLDPEALGVLYLGDASVLVDPYTGLSTNQVRARVELEATCHVRNIVHGAFVIAP